MCGGACGEAGGVVVDSKTLHILQAFFEIFTDANTGLIDCKKLVSA